MLCAHVQACVVVLNVGEYEHITANTSIITYITIYITVQYNTKFVTRLKPGFHFPS